MWAKIKKISVKQLLIFIVVTFILDKINIYLITPNAPSLDVFELLGNFSVFLELAYFVAFIWLIIKLLTGIGKKDYGIGEKENK